MHRFSDLLAIDLDIKISLILDVVAQNGDPVCAVNINGHELHHGPLNHTREIVRYVPLTDHIEIEIILTDKHYSNQRETALIIQQLSIDGFDIVPRWTHLATYINDKGRGDATNYLGFNGVWRFKIDRPFYVWRHSVTSQGWLLEPTTAVRDCVPSSSNTIDD